MVVSLTASAASGTAPLYVMFESIATTHVDSDISPFGDLNYGWSFGDSADTFATTGYDRRSAVGPFAAHVFEEAGTYAVSVTVEDESGEIETVQAFITVDALDEGYAASDIHCFSNDSDHTGCPVGAVQHDFISDFDVALDTHCGIDEVDANGACLFKGGDTFTVSTSTVIQLGEHHIGPYGTGRYIVDATSFGDTPLFQGNASESFENLTIWGGDFRGNNLTGNAAHAIVNCTGGTDDWDYTLVHDNLITGWGHTISCANGTSPEQVPDLIAVSENVITEPGNRSMGYFEATRVAQIGNTAVNDAGTNSGHMRLKFFKKHLIQHNSFTGVSENQVFRVNGEAASSTTSSQITDVASNHYYINSDNFATNEEDGDTAIAFIGGDYQHAGDMRYAIIERNTFMMESNATGRALQSCFSDIWVRNNVTIQNSLSSNGVWEMHDGSCTGGARSKVYNNTAYGTGTNPRVMVSLNSTNIDSFVRNNLYYTPDDTGTNRVVSGTPGTGSTVSDNFQFDDNDELAGNTVNGGDGLFDEPADLRLVTGSTYDDGGFDFLLDTGDGESLFYDFTFGARSDGGNDVGALQAP